MGGTEEGGGGERGFEMPRWKWSPSRALPLGCCHMCARQPVLSARSFPGISSADTLKVYWEVGAGPRPSDCSATHSTLCPC